MLLSCIPTYFNLPEYRFHDFLNSEVGFASQSDPRIQAADLVAREAMKDMDNDIGPMKRPRRLSMDTLLQTKRFQFRRLELPFFEDLRRKADDMGSLPGAKMSQYRQWLSDHKYNDNTSNRIRYLAYIDSSAREAKKGST